QDGQALDHQVGARSAREPQVRLRIMDNGRDPRAGFRGYVEVAGFGIEAAALPERSAGSAGIVPGALRSVRLDFGGWREHRAEAILLGDLHRLGPQLRRE